MSKKHKIPPANHGQGTASRLAKAFEAQTDSLHRDAGFGPNPFSNLPVKIPQWYLYYWRVFTRCGAESYRTWRGEMLASVLIASFAYLFTAPGDRGAWETFKIILLATACGLGVMGLWHLVRAPLLIHRETVGGDKKAEVWSFGIFGLLLTVGILVGGFLVLMHVNKVFKADDEKLHSLDGRLLAAESQRDTYKTQADRVPRLEQQVQELQSKTGAGAPRAVPAAIQGTPVEESPNSLRRRTVRLANELEIWEKKVYTNYPNPIGSDDTTLQKRRNEFDVEVNQKYLQEFRGRTVEVVKALESKGLDVWVMTAEWGVAKRMPRAEEIAHLRDLAHYLDANDNVVHF